MTLRLASILALAPLLCSQAQAQESGDRARLDDFAIPHAAETQTSQIDQLGERESGIRTTQRPLTRSVEIQNIGVPSGDQVTQVSRGGPNTESQQLSERDDAGDIADVAVSSSADSRIGNAVRLQGTDRCDPKAGEEATARCLAILELRASEFDAVEAPQLSPEQVLLAERGERPDRRARPSTDQHLRHALTDPDADSRSNQELAAYSFGQSPPQTSVGQPEAEESPDAMAELVEAIRISATLPQGGS